MSRTTKGTKGTKGDHGCPEEEPRMDTDGHGCGAGPRIVFRWPAFAVQRNTTPPQETPAGIGVHSSPFVVKPKCPLW